MILDIELNSLCSSVTQPAYPFAAPDMMILTPNGRFEVGKKVSSVHIVHIGHEKI